MKNSIRYLLLAILSANCITLGCSDEPVLPAPPVDNPSPLDPGVHDPVPGEPGADEPGLGDPDECTDACKIDEFRCFENAMMTCQKSETGCL